MTKEVLIEIIKSLTDEEIRNINHDNYQPRGNDTYRQNRSKDFVCLDYEFHNILCHVQESIILFFVKTGDSLLQVKVNIAPSVIGVK